MNRLVPPPGNAPDSWHGIVSTSAEMAEVFARVERAARTEASVLVRGETGTGKELVARALHDLSPRASRPFRAINCATLRGELLASELFGHVKGAFTGAARAREGLFAQCRGGTLFLDEIAELPLEIQPQLLRVLQEQIFVPVGGTQPVETDVRLISATHRALRAEVAAGRFRADLMYRVRVAPIFLPALRERIGDVAALTWHFVAQFNRSGGRKVTHIDAQALAAIERYDWPGNVRELRNAIEGAFALGEGEVLTLEDLPPELRGEVPPMEEVGNREDRRRRRVVAALQSSSGNKAEAAARLDVSRTTLWRWMREFGLDD